MIEIISKDKCSGCHACFNICPKNCIQMIPDEEGFLYPHVDKGQCIKCGLCENICPIIHKLQTNDSVTTNAIAAINLNEDIRLRSSSGGIFTLIAEEVLNQGGVVFGAAFTEDFKAVHHIRVNNSGNLKKLRGSKYVQSNINDTYKQAKNFLDTGFKVLFTGTPCQIAGLYSYLQKDYKNLYTQDIICHGVPSPMLWEKYVEERETKSASKTQQIFFRYKKYGWKIFSVLFKFSNNKSYVKTLREDSFMRLFLSNTCLRPSCYNCSFKSIHRPADITLADFWGIQNVLPEMDDDKGTSMILIHSEKGKQLISNINNYIKSKDISIDIVEKYNPSVIKSVDYNKNREEFFSKLESKRINSLAKEYCKVPLKVKAKSIIMSTKPGRKLINFILK